LRFLLHPGWLLVTLLVLAFATSCFTLLAPWQFRRNAERSATNAAVTASFTAAPARLGQLDPRAEWRRATLTGSYLPAGEALARLRTVQGEPAYEVLTPFQLTDGTVVLIDRGYLRPGENSQVPAYPAAPAGRVDLVARLRVDETDPGHRPAFDNHGRREVYAVDSGTVGRAAGLAIRPGYLQLEAGSPGVLSALPLPELDSGPFLSYALQWLAFGTMAILAWIYFTWREIKPGGALAEPRPETPKRRSVAQQIAEEEAAERSLHPSAAAEQRQ
jgi:cytochrome oxidase assembly protein ShyY1